MGHIHKLGLQNFRIFKSKEVLDFAPITILTGTNNSGKSTAIKCLQLLKASATATGGLDKLLFTDGNHNLGSYENTTNNEVDSDEITITLSLPGNDAGLEADLELVFWKIGKQGENGRLAAFRVVQNGKILIECRDESRNPTSKIEGGYVPYHFLIDMHALGDHIKLRSKIKTSQKSTQNIDDDISDEIFEPPIEEIRAFIEQQSSWIQEERDWVLANNSVFTKFFHRPAGSILFSDINKEDLDLKLLQPVSLAEPIDPDDEIRDQMLEQLPQGLIFHLDEENAGTPIEMLSRFLTVLGRRRFGKNGESKYKLSVIGEYIFGTLLGQEIPNCLARTATSLGGLYHLSSVRASAERLYSNRSSSSEFHALILDFSQYYMGKGTDRYKFIQKYLKEFNIGDGLLINRIEGVASSVYLMQGDKQILLADLGFGYTQLLPILLKIAIIATHNARHEENMPAAYHSSTFLLEEPESNLHPSYQSKIADMIIEAGELFNIQFILETHSEYLIRKLQYHTATGKLKPRDTAIYYFEGPKSKSKKTKRVRKITIQKDGRLSAPFGEGFFDETPRLMLSIMNLSDEN